MDDRKYNTINSEKAFLSEYPFKIQPAIHNDSVKFNVQGPRGNIGPTGPVGPIGSRGDIGPTGPSGQCLCQPIRKIRGKYDPNNPTDNKTEDYFIVSDSINTYQVNYTDPFPDGIIPIPMVVIEYTNSTYVKMVDYIIIDITNTGFTMRLTNTSINTVKYIHFIIFS
jgi:hypothetical protein